MKLLSFDKNQILAMVTSHMIRPESEKHWDICKALCEGKTIETVAEDFHMSSRNVASIKKRKCKNCD